MLYQSGSKDAAQRWGQDERQIAQHDARHTRLHKSYESFRLAGKFVAWVFYLFVFRCPVEKLHTKS